MKNFHKAAVLAAIGLASLSASTEAATYNGDLIIGFSGTGSSSDLIYDLGSASSLFDGEQWTLGSLLSGIDLTTVMWGVIGDVNSGSPRTAWTTTGGVVPPAVPGAGTVNAINTSLKSIYQNVGPNAGAGNYAVVLTSDDNSWKSQTIAPSLVTQYKNVYGDPNVTGLTTASLFLTPGNNSVPTLLGTFSLAANGTVTYNVTPVPEPGTYGLLAVGGLVVLALRSQFRRKQV